MLDKLVSDLVGPSVSGAAACFATGDEETTAAAGDVKADDVFTIASVTKTFVAAATLRLAADGVLGLEEPAARWCDLAPADVTVRMLLDHTSRIPDYVAVPGVIEAHLREPARVWDPRELVRLATGREGEWRYSNTNYVLLGLVLEAATSKSLDSVLHELVLAPLDLHSTRLPRSPAASFAWAAGGIESTPPEACRFLAALLRDELVDTTELRRTVEVTDNVEFDRYGAGIAVISSILRFADSPCGAGWGHLGFGLNESAAALAAPDGSRCLAVCTRGALDECGWRVLAEGVCRSSVTREPGPRLRCVFRSKAEQKVADAGYDPARLPPGQYLTEKWPVLHAGDVPETDLASWDFKVFGEVENPIALTWEQLQELPSTEITIDIHCVTRWSRFDTTFRGVHWRELAKLVRPKPSARFVVAHAEQDFTSNAPLEALEDEKALIAYQADGGPLEPEHGWPLRLVIPTKYFWKSAKWLRGLELLDHDHPGFWERYGYHNDADYWKEERYSF